MPDSGDLLVFIVAGLVLNATPGPDVLYIVGRSIGQGRLAGLVSALGIAAGCLVHVAASALGFSALLGAVPIAFDAVRYAGAAYLVWLGVGALRRPSGPLAPGRLDHVPLGRVFAQGLLTNVLNPKVALFFLAFLPQFTDAARGSLALQFTLLGLLFIVNGLAVCVAYALAASWVAERLLARYAAAIWLNRAMGGLFIGLGLRLALGVRR